MNSAFSPDDRLLATASVDGPMRIWDVDRASLFTTITGHHALIEHLEFSPVDSNMLLTASHDGTARLWDVDGVLTTDLLHEHPPTFAVFSPDNVHLLTGGGDAKGHLWDVAGREIAEFDTGEIVHSAAFSPDGGRIATASSQVGFWSGTLRANANRERSNLRSGFVRYSVQPGGRPFGSRFGSGHGPVWDAATGAESPPSRQARHCRRSFSTRRAISLRCDRQRRTPGETRRNRTEEAGRA